MEYKNRTFIVNLYRRSSTLDQRLLAIEQKLDSLGSIDRFGAGRQPPLPDPASPAGLHTESPNRDPGAHTDGAIFHGDDGVDGMGAVSLKDGGDEEEYFGKKI